MFKKERLTFLQILLQCDNNIFKNLNSWQMWRKGGPLLLVKIPRRHLCHTRLRRALFPMAIYDTYFPSPLKRFFNWSLSSLNILSQHF